MQKEAQRQDMEQGKRTYEKPAISTVQLFADMVLDGECKFSNQAPTCGNPTYLF